MGIGTFNHAHQKKEYSSDNDAQDKKHNKQVANTSPDLQQFQLSRFSRKSLENSFVPLRATSDNRKLTFCPRTILDWTLNWNI